MIYTVTLNPAIDKTIQLNTLKPGALNIVEKSLTNIGGKGINVSMVLKELGSESTALGLAGGKNGRYITEELTRAGINNFFSNTGKETRTNIKIMEKDGNLTELNEKGALVEESLVDEFVKEIEARITEGDIIVLSGSVPEGVPVTIYADLIKISHDKGAKVILDADGELFFNGIKAGPDVIKPNISEYIRYLKKESSFDEAVFLGEDILSARIFLEGVKNLFAQNISQIILSMGAKGAYFFDRNSEEILYCNALPVQVQSTVGAGDSMVAAWAYALSKEYAFEKSVKLAIATSAAAVTTPGTMAPNIEKVKELESQVKARRITDV